ncbi:MAG TPA: MlaA family lipoprotein [Verrucomicrobiae bacterium]|nr:MlaA family lipoprotein [Verrucomicrobiae bacterium]
MMKSKYCTPYLIALASLLVTALPAQPPASVPAMGSPEQTNTIIPPSPLRDPIEPFNRAVWSFDTELMTSVIKPASRGYRFVVPKPAREGIANVGRNLAFPGRFINEFLQGNFKAMGDETARCLCNTIFGLGGIFDVATRANIPKRDADFGQTFKKWGCQPGIFLMLPLFGPSDIRDGSGLVADFAANPLTYFFPYDCVGPSVTANNFSDTVDESVRFSQVEPDSYSILLYAWTFTHENRPVDLRLIGNQDPASLETLQSFFSGYSNPKFLDRGKTRAVLIPATGRKLDFTFWLQPGTAPVVYLIPGFGAHRLARNELEIADLLVSNGFSVVTISSTYNPDFMNRASTSEIPDYPPNGIHDLHVALTVIDRYLDATYPSRLGSRAIMGYSMGAFQSLFLAAAKDVNHPLIEFQRYVAIDAPVRLRYAVTNLDQYYNAPLAWPADKREADIENTLLKVAFLATQPALQTNLPFNAIESKFLIGLSFRLALRDMIFSSQLRCNQKILRQPVKTLRRRAIYNEILKYSLKDYIDKFATPYDKTRGIDLSNPIVVKRGTDLTTYTAELRENPDVRLILNRNDFLLATQDVSWIESTFTPQQRTIFPEGGHLGNLNQSEVQKAILQTLDGLGLPRAKSANDIGQSSNNGNGI